MAKVYTFVGKEGRRMITVFDVADYFLSRVDFETGSLMTHLKLQKMCYYAQAWHLVFDNDPMFKQTFQAWAHGPVCPDLWNKYKEYKWHSIPSPEEFDGKVFKDAEVETLEAVWDAYSQFDGRYLEDLTHEEAPWVIARGSCPPGEACDNVITWETMKEFYTRLQENG
jgi:uncharacterized phage-associated protein